MKPYLATTCVIFGLLALVHIWRIVVEPSAAGPWFLLLTAIAAAFAIWAGVLLRRARQI